MRAQFLPVRNQIADNEGYEDELAQGNDLAYTRILLKNREEDYEYAKASVDNMLGTDTLERSA